MDLHGIYSAQTGWTKHSLELGQSFTDKANTNGQESTVTPLANQPYLTVGENTKRPWGGFRLHLIRCASSHNNTLLTFFPSLFCEWWCVCVCEKQRTRVFIGSHFLLVSVNRMVFVAALPYYAVNRRVRLQTLCTERAEQEIMGDVWEHTHHRTKTQT